MSKYRGPSLYDFLIEADLVEYYSGLKEKLNISNASYLNFVIDEDLHGIGMSNPDIRRLKDHFEKYFPQTVLGKVKKMILSKNKRDKWEPTNFSTDSDTHLVDDKVSGRVTNNKHIIPFSAITIHKELGSGEFGVVHQGTWSTDEGRMQVAVKSLSNHRMQTNPIDFLKEAAIMHQIDHENIVPLHGVVLDAPSFLLVTELAPLRSLLECLKETSPSFRINFSVPTLCDFAVQICNGMKYLEEKRLIHRDLAARNILVFQKDKVKISDFGLSRALRVGKDYYQTNYNVNLKLPVAWCAPEIVNFLRFTSASDVWAYGVTLWEMFSYGFQPWAALSGSQILSAIDFPNFQRLEQPECCPVDYYKIMLKCWEHEPRKRLTFLDLSKSLPDCKPEQVQAINDSVEDRVKRDQLMFKIGDIITVLDKKPTGAPENYWKGVLNNGRCGFFDPTHTVTYLGINFPSNKMGKFVRGESKLYTSRRRSKLKPEMISFPEKDFKHTAHIGVDGAYFGDVKGILPPVTKYNNLPHQIVAPYKPQDDSVSYEPSISNPVYQSDKAPLLSSDGQKTRSDGVWMDYESIKTSNVASSSKLLDHEYHEIANGENYLESPRFEKAFDFGPSLLDEMEAVMKTLGTETNNSMVNGVSNYGASPPPSPMDKDINKFKELRDITCNTHWRKKKPSTVKSISAADQKTIDSAIAMANELATRAISDAEDGKFGRPDSPDTPCSPNKKKFSFKFPITSSTLCHSTKFEKKNISKEDITAPDLQNLRIYSSVNSLPVSCNIESLKEISPYHILPWDKTSTEVSFVRSHALLTKHHPSLFPLKKVVLNVSQRSGEGENDFNITGDNDNISVVSIIESESECSDIHFADDTSHSLNIDEYHSYYLYDQNCGMTDVKTDYKIIEHSKTSFYTNENVDSSSNIMSSIEFGCTSEQDTSQISEVKKDGLSISSYDWVYTNHRASNYSSASSETLIDDTSMKFKYKIQKANGNEIIKSFPSSPLKNNECMKSNSVPTYAVTIRKATFDDSSTENEDGESDGDYKTATCEKNNSSSSQGSKYTLSRSRCGSTSSDDFEEIMRTFNKNH